MNRTPPTAVRRELRKEVKFGCPINGCGNPYLHWHHFDPPWEEEEHHNPSGMIALCAEHHSKADAGAYTKEQLREFKRKAAQREHLITGQFEWMRNRLLAVVGGNFCYETPIIVEFRGQPVIWLNRDDDGYLLLNVRMLSTLREPRVAIEDNFWITTGNPVDLECPPSGKLLKAKYENGDELKIEFIELQSLDAAKRRYPEAGCDHWNLSFPITAVEVFEMIGGTELRFGPKETTLPGHNVIRGCFMSNCRVGLGIG